MEMSESDEIRRLRDIIKQKEMEATEMMRALDQMNQDSYQHT